MDYTIDFTAGPDMVVITTSGEAALDAWRRYHLELLADPRYTPGLSILVDHSALDWVALTNDQVREIGRIVRSFNEQVRTGRRAVVVSGQLAYGLVRMSQGQMVGAEERIKVFRSREEAEAWLQEDAA